MNVPRWIRKQKGMKRKESTGDDPIRYLFVLRILSSRKGPDVAQDFCASGVKEEEEEEEEERLTPARNGTRALFAGARITAFSLQLQHETRLPRDYTLQLQMKSTEVDQGLFTDTYCKVCSAQLISESQRVAHYESRKHANKVRLYYMLHPVDGGCPAKKLRTHNGSEEGDVDKNKCCTLCNMSFTSAVVAESHYQGKIHAKRLKLVLGEQPGIIGKASEEALCEESQLNLGPLKAHYSSSEALLIPSEVTPSPVKKPSESWPQLNGDSDRYCQLCHAWFNNPGMARQHYDGKKHKKNAARADLLEQLGKTLNMGEMKGLKRSYTCDVCSVTLNSVAQYHAHLQGSKHQNK
ncbi:zinc finger matrin-type protein 4 [Silurus asotus]|uniref:Zinc finger matrin-type protein 4 n=1 Tax=Silurus asotus TaxID=30991 RepID=A0AAD5ALT4_SILAS|nr:zinc finger matrin-type protein 4 [Silurus asotus]